MNAQATPKPVPADGDQTLSAEDRAIIESLELLEALDWLETWGVDEALPPPGSEGAEAP